MQLFKKPLLKKHRAGKVAFHMATIVDSVEKLIEKKALVIDGSAIYLYAEMLSAAPVPKNYVKNLFLYCRVKELIKKDQILFIKDVETNEILATYAKEKATLYI